MRIAVFSSKTYDREYLDKFNIGDKHELTYFDASLNSNTTNLTLGFEAVCVFVNDKIEKGTIEKLSENGVKLIALRCAGFNNVDITAATEKKYQGSESGSLFPTSSGRTCSRTHFDPKQKDA